jgi:hypothetical protein
MTTSSAGVARWNVFVRLIVLTALAVASAAAVLLISLLSGDISGEVAPPSPIDAILQRDSLAYPLHSLTARVVERVGGPPSVAAAQWVKAASHARSQVEVEDAGRGIRQARERAGDAMGLDASICAVLERAAPRVRAAIELSGAACNLDLKNVTHYPKGSAIPYRTWPPSGGPHYPEWYPNYGVLTQRVRPGYWVHNLEHGAIVLAYYCPAGCPELVDELISLYEALPRGTSAGELEGRLLAVPIEYLDHRLAVIAWGEVLFLDEVDHDRILKFYSEHVNRGPECRDLRCPP